MQPHIGEGPYAYVHIDEQCPVSHPSDRNFADFVIKDESGNALLDSWLFLRLGRIPPQDNAKVVINGESSKVFYGKLQEKPAIMSIQENAVAPNRR